MSPRAPSPALLPLTLILAILASACPRKPPDPPPSCNGCEIIHPVRVMDANGVREGRRVTLSAGIILSEQPDEGPIPTGAREVDGAGGTLVPGLWDSHVHLTPSGGVNLLAGIDVPQHLKGLLYSGVTGVLDLGSPRDTIFALRDRVELGELLSPRLRIAGPLFTAPGGHPCITDRDPQSCDLVTTAPAAEALVNALAARSPDFVKLVLEAGGPPLQPLPRLSRDQAAWITAAAQRRGLRAFAHVSSAQDAADALDANVAVLAHVPYRDLLSEELVSRCASSGVAAITTLASTENVLHYVDHPEYLEDPGVLATVPPPVLAELGSPAFRDYLTSGAGQAIVTAARTFTANQAENLRRLRARGVPLLAGSDAGNFLLFHGPALHRELELLVAAGLTPLEALTSATLAPAALLGIDAQFGRVATGYRADLVLVAGDPSADIRALRDVREVWLDGSRLDRAALRASTPRSAVLLRTRTVEPGSFCVQDQDCGQGFGCDSRVWRCLRTCDTTAPATCPAGEGCVGVTYASTRGWCQPSEGCDPLLQNCPFAEVYGTTCVPWESDFTFCAPPGQGGVGDACTWYDRNGLCGTGLFCDGARRCAALCDPAGAHLPACETGQTCVDQQATWGQPAGLCR